MSLQICYLNHTHFLVLPHIFTLVTDIALQGVCTESGMYALRERRVHVTQEDFELAVAKVIVFYVVNLYRKVYFVMFSACLLC